MKFTKFDFYRLYDRKIEPILLPFNRKIFEAIP